MDETKFNLHLDCELPCIHIEVYKNGELVIDTEADLKSQIIFIDKSIVDNYNSELINIFNNTCDELKNYIGTNISILEILNKIQKINRKKFVLDSLITERNANV